MKAILVGCALLGLFSAGCSSSGGGDGSSNNNLSIGTDPSQGVFHPTQMLTNADTSIYTTGCQTPGQTTPVYQIDPRLKPGMVIDETVKGFGGGSNFSANLETTIQTITSTTLVESQTVLNISGIPGVNQGFTTVETLTLQNNADFSTSYNPAPPAFNFPGNNCEFSADSGSGIAAKFAGQYFMASGQLVSAQRSYFQATGTVTCNNQNLGHGTGVYVVIASNDVPSEGSSNFCGGVQVYEYYLLSKDDGTPIASASAERTRFK